MRDFISTTCALPNVAAVTDPTGFETGDDGKDGGKSTCVDAASGGDRRSAGGTDQFGSGFAGRSATFLRGGGSHAGEAARNRAASQRPAEVGESRESHTNRSANCANCATSRAEYRELHGRIHDEYMSNTRGIPRFAHVLCFVIWLFKNCDSHDSAPPSGQA